MIVNPKTLHAENLISQYWSFYLMMVISRSQCFK